MATEDVLYHITGNSQLSNTNVDEISAIVKEYPFFSPAQFLLALKQKKEHSYNFEYQLQKASLYFSNQVWLNYLLSEKEIATPDLSLSEVAPSILPRVESMEESIFPTSIIGSKSYHPHEEDEQPLPVIIENVTEEFHHEEAENSIPLNNDIPFDYSSLFTDSNSNIEVPTLEAVKDILASKPAEKEVPISSPEAQLPTPPEIFPSTVTAVISNSRIPSFSFISSEPKINEQTVFDEPSPSIYVSRPTSKFEEVAEIVPIIELPLAESPNEDIPTNIPSEPSIPSYSFKGFSEESSTEQIPSDTVSISEAFAKNYANSEEEGDADDTDYNNNISAVISTQLEGFNKPVEENAKFEFEQENNLHTIDYFASQGIKIDLTKLPQDKLTVQMRRFTDWLKQIKTTDPNPQDLGTDPELEKAIQNIAKTSIEAKEIVTETMADVFIKQGKVNKAIQLYIKLSFLDPSKSTYFANKIQQLKGI